MESVYVTRTTKLIEYMKIHLISLYQDMNKIQDIDTNEWHDLNGQIKATEHLLEVTNDNV
jgi:hypothetical protein